MGFEYNASGEIMDNAAMFKIYYPNNQKEAMKRIKQYNTTKSFKGMCCCICQLFNNVR